MSFLFRFIRLSTLLIFHNKKCILSKYETGILVPLPKTEIATELGHIPFVRLVKLIERFSNKACTGMVLKKDNSFSLFQLTINNNYSLN